MERFAATRCSCSRTTPAEESAVHRLGNSTTTWSSSSSVGRSATPKCVWVCEWVCERERDCAITRGPSAYYGSPGHRAEHRSVRIAGVRSEAWDGVETRERVHLAATILLVRVSHLWNDTQVHAKLVNRHLSAILPLGNYLKIEKKRLARVREKVKSAGLSRTRRGSSRAVSDARILRSFGLTGRTKFANSVFVVVCCASRLVLGMSFLGIFGLAQCDRREVFFGMRTPGAIGQ